MALWRDPLDDLIADLERAVPVSPAGNADENDWHARLIGGQLWLGAMLSGTPADLARVEHDPRVIAYLAWIARLATRTRATTPTG